MTGQRSMAVAWIARVLGILLAAMLAMAWWAESGARREPLASGEVSGTWLYQWAVVSHVLPLLVIIAAVAIGWRRPVIAAVLVVGYAVASVFSYAPEWGYAPLVSGPPLVIGALYAADWWIWRRKI